MNLMKPTPQPASVTDAADLVLAVLLEDDLLAAMLTPPRVPSFCADTIRPGASS